MDAVISGIEAYRDSDGDKSCESSINSGIIFMCVMFIGMGSIFALVVIIPLIVMARKSVIQPGSEIRVYINGTDYSRYHVDTDCILDGRIVDYT